MLRCHHAALALAGVVLLLASFARGGDSPYPIERGYPGADSAFRISGPNAPACDGKRNLNDIVETSR